MIQGRKAAERFQYDLFFLFGKEYAVNRCRKFADFTAFLLIKAF